MVSNMNIIKKEWTKGEEFLIALNEVNEMTNNTSIATILVPRHEMNAILNAVDENGWIFSEFLESLGKNPFTTDGVDGPIEGRPYIYGGSFTVYDKDS